MTDEERQAWLRAMAATLFDGALSVIEADPHQWSARPCASCRVVGGIVGRNFGCYLYAAKNAKARAGQ